MAAGRYNDGKYDVCKGKFIIRPPVPEKIKLPISYQWRNVKMKNDSEQLN